MSSGAELLLVTCAFGLPTTLVIIGLARQASRRRQGLDVHAMARSRRTPPSDAAPYLVLSLMVATASIFFAWGLGLSPWLIVLLGDAAILPFGLMGVQKWRANGTLGTFGMGEALCLLVAAAFVVATAATRVTRNDHLASVPAEAVPSPSCPASTVVPDVGNELNHTVAGTTSSAVVGSKLYVTDARAASGIRLEGTAVVCDAGHSNNGEILVATHPGTSTLYVTAVDGDVYRVTVQVATPA